MDGEESYSIAVIGGATAGAEAAGIFSEQGILTVVFEQNARPYGKIEDGLPRWHKLLREKEYRTIDQKLTQPHVHLVPETKVGRDLELRELTDHWGFHAVVLANGAWSETFQPGDYSLAGLGDAQRVETERRIISSINPCAPVFASLDPGTDKHRSVDEDGPTHRYGGWGNCAAWQARVGPVEGVVDCP